MIDTVGKQEYIQAFNYASLAANNSFFLDNLASYKMALLTLNHLLTAFLQFVETTRS